MRSPLARATVFSRVLLLFFVAEGFSKGGIGLGQQGILDEIYRLFIKVNDKTVE